MKTIASNPEAVVIELGNTCDGINIKEYTKILKRYDICELVIPEKVTIRQHGIDITVNAGIKYEVMHMDFSDLILQCLTNRKIRNRRHKVTKETRVLIEVVKLMEEGQHIAQEKTARAEKRRSKRLKQKAKLEQTTIPALPVPVNMSTATTKAETKQVNKPVAGTKSDLNKTI
jgi:hypothetical protein